MKKLPIILILGGIVALASCTKENNGPDTPSAQDLAAKTGMDTELALVKSFVDSLVHSQHNTEQHHFDSLIHHHDSLFWYHHGNYSHGNEHDDHHHDTDPHHTGHPNSDHGTHHHDDHTVHHHDSTHVNMHHGNHHHSDHGNNHDNSDGHHQGHHIGHHDQLDSLIHVQHIHHP